MSRKIEGGLLTYGGILKVFGAFELLERRVWGGRKRVV